MSRVWRMLRHDLATPLSGALLHLEVARRRAARGKDGEEGGVRESLETVQAQIERSAAILELASAFQGFAPDEPAAFDPAEAVARSTRSLEPQAAARGLAVELAASGTAAAFGSAAQVERAAAALTQNAVESASGAGRLSWSVARDGGRVQIVLRFPGTVAAGHPEAIFGLNGDRADRERAFRLVLARFVVEGHGGHLAIGQEGDTVRISGDLPEEAP
jgi:signal transduction histidine kinase